MAFLSRFFFQAVPKTTQLDFEQKFRAFVRSPFEGPVLNHSDREPSSRGADADGLNSAYQEEAFD